MNQVQIWFSELRGALSPQGLFSRVDTERCLAALDRIERELPDVIFQANEIVSQKERILTAAQNQADAQLRETESHVQREVSQSALVKRATVEAEQILADARREGQRILDSQARIAGDALKRLEEFLTAMAGQTHGYVRQLTNSN